MSLAALLSYSIEELREELSRLLPQGWTFDYDRTDGGYLAGDILDGEGKSEWNGAQIDERLLLLDVIGWVLTRGTPIHHPAWVRGPTIETTGKMPEVVFEDPPDLVPEEVHSVYKGKHKSK